MKIEVLQPDFHEPYERFLLENPYSLFFQSLKYKNFLRQLLECEEEYLLAIEEDQIRGVLPLMYIRGNSGRVYNSLPYYSSNGGIISDDPEARLQLAAAYNEITNRKSTLSATLVTNPFVRHEERNDVSIDQPGEYDSGSLEDAAEIRFNYTDYRIGQFTNISSQGKHGDDIMPRIDSSARRNIKKAIREGITVEIDHNQTESLRQMHQENLREIGGLPKSDEFFASIARQFTPGKDFDIYVAKKDGLIVAGLLLFYFNQTVEYFTPAIDSEYRSAQPLSLILITAMTDACRRGFVWWNWGATGASQTGVYRFKKKWGAREADYRYYTQLNDCSILEWPQADILGVFPNFFVVPFSALNTGDKHE